MRRPPVPGSSGHPYRNAGASGPECPCDAHQLQYVAHASGTSYFACPACHGIWIDSEDLRTLVAWSVASTNESADGDDTALARAYAMGRQKTRAALRCPACGDEMIAEEHRRDSYVLVDICPAGCGKWLDDDELRRLIAYTRRSH